MAGSHTLQELQHWSAFLINTQVIHISYLEQSEAFQLIQNPFADFKLQYHPKAVQRIWELCRGQPHLVQLLCYELVTLKNEQPLSRRFLACLEGVESAVPLALHSGAFFFADIEKNRINPGGAAMLRRLACMGEGAILPKIEWRKECPQHFDQHVRRFLQRELIEPIDSGYRFQIELVRRWFVSPLT